VTVAAAPDARNARPVILTAPLLDGTLYLGDVSLTIRPDGDVEASTTRILDLLAPALEPETMKRLRTELAGQPYIGPAMLGSSGLQLRYLPQTVALVVDVPLAVRARRSLSIAPGHPDSGGAFDKPARVSGYISAQGSLRFADKWGDGQGPQGTIFLEGVARVGSVVFESDGLWQAGPAGSNFQRRDSRLVFDEPGHALRFSLGDLDTTGRGFQSAPALTGFSLVRSYGLLQPQTLVRPSGRGSFTLDRASVVDVMVNDRLLRRIELQPGGYSLRDFPFAQGANDVHLLIRDDSGRTEIIRFNLFFDQSQLAPGIDEFGVFAGVYAPPGMTGPVYTADWGVSGYYSRGLTERLTLGGNFQADARGVMAGTEAVLASPFGTVHVGVAASRHEGEPAGFAAALAFQRTLGTRDGAASAISLSLEGASRGFMPVGPWAQRSPYSRQVGVDYVHAFSAMLSGGLGFRAARAWDRDRDVESFRANLGWSPSRRTRITADATYDAAGSWGPRPAFAFHIGFQLQLGIRASAAADYDSASGTGRLSYRRSGGTGVGAYSGFAELEAGPAGAGLNLDASYVANRGELGLSRFTNLDGNGRSITSLRIGSAIAFADGAVSVGAPIRDSFAIVTRHRTLAGSEIQVDPSGTGYAASTGALGTALRADLGAYLESTITVQSPDAPPTADLGRGAFRVMPPYRSGYRLQVGSDYSVSVVGRLLDAAGRPLSLLAGEAREEGANGVAIALFTNAEGRFGATGLKSGRWRIIFATDPETRYLLVIPANAGSVFSAGVLAPQGGG
jgi:outer membrane usher protein